MNDIAVFYTNTIIISVSEFVSIYNITVSENKLRVIDFSVLHVVTSCAGSGLLIFRF